MTEKVVRSDKDGLCTLTLNRPDKLNALDTETFEQLDAHLAALAGQTNTIGCVVLRGAGRAFCAGADLGAVTTTLGLFKPKVIQHLQALPQPTVAAVHGVCMTGALELALACDFIVAEAGTRLADTHGKWGLVGSWGMSQRLPRRIGAAAAKRMMFTARTVEAAEAHTMGLVDLVADAGGLDALVTAFTGEILANSWHTNVETKKLMLATEGMPLAEALAHEQYHYPGFAPDFEERVAAFSKK
ncbi:MAG: enoyl-CoA hydratase/isomerase family protein [Novosphingobium sp.]